MNVELTIQEMYNEYPTLFIDRVDALNHLFCTIGNGYDWKNGELVSSGYSYPKKKDIEKNIGTNSDVRREFRKLLSIDSLVRYWR